MGSPVALLLWLEFGVSCGWHTSLGHNKVAESVGTLGYCISFWGNGWGKMGWIHGGYSEIFEGLLYKKVSDLFQCPQRVWLRIGEYSSDTFWLRMRKNCHSKVTFLGKLQVSWKNSGRGWMSENNCHSDFLFWRLQGQSLFLEPWFPTNTTFH